MGADLPVSKVKTRRGQKAPAPDAASASLAKVWVNTTSGKYFGPTSRYYGKTKSGQYMTEASAKKAGYVAAGGR